MKQYEVDPYDPSMTDAEFFQLMDVENLDDVYKTFEIEPEEELTQPKMQDHKITALKTLLPLAAATAMLVVLILV